MALVLHVPQRAGEAEYVHIADDNGNTYQDSLDNFALDHGSVFPPLPTDAIGREYDAGVRHYTYSVTFELTDASLVWADGDNIIAVVETLNVAKMERLAPPDPTYTLDEIRTEALRGVDHAAEFARQRHITKGPGQAMAYIEKSDEAADYAAAGYPADLSTYPFIQAEANATGLTPTQAADNILARKAAWIAIGAAVEESRLRGKINIDNATDQAGVTSAQDAAIVELEAI